LQSVRFRFAVHSAREGERQAILWQKLVTLPSPKPQEPDEGSHVTACLAGSHKIESFSRQANYIEADLWQFGFCARDVSPNVWHLFLSFLRLGVLAFETGERYAQLLVTETDSDRPHAAPLHLTTGWSAAFTQPADGM